MGTLTVISGILGALALHLLASEIYGNVPTIAERLIRRAVRKLEPAMRVRYEEEWLSHLAHCDGSLGKLWHAVGCFICARKLAQLRDTQRVAEDLRLIVKFEGEMFDVSLGTMVDFMKTLRNVMIKERLSGSHALDEAIGVFEREFVVGPPNLDEKIRIAKAFFAFTTKMRGNSSSEKRDEESKK